MLQKEKERDTERGERENAKMIKKDKTKSKQMHAPVNKKQRQLKTSARESRLVLTCMLPEMLADVRLKLSLLPALLAAKQALGCALVQVGGKDCRAAG